MINILQSAVGCTYWRIHGIQGEEGLVTNSCVEMQQHLVIREAQQRESVAHWQWEDGLPLDAS